MKKRPPEVKKCKDMHKALKISIMIVHAFHRNRLKKKQSLVGRQHRHPEVLAQHLKILQNRIECM